ncbi:hypothetical protein [Microbacterium immunditiarum]|uniref:Uncharacterized protein n=1 Tax=Microbacterium immunditiarum TaxID=337480 RepID=A0A7Y9GNK2_9MICO|nr:hypothetical protein [Microbacterium immunditiarum]NYE19834.1 hypothetical protein [Microbacterium immunditiarum]
MQTQTRFVVGGAMSVAASVAVACAVALTHSAALADEAGVAIGEGAIVVPSRADATPNPDASRHPASTPVTVPAPEPRDVTVAQQPDQIPDGQPTAPAAPSAAEEETLIREVERTRSWERVREWARERGWDEERVREFIERLRDRSSGDRYSGSHDKDSAEDGGRFDDRREWWSGLIDQSRYSPDSRD